MYTLVVFCDDCVIVVVFVVVFVVLWWWWWLWVVVDTVYLPCLTLLFFVLLISFDIFNNFF